MHRREGERQQTVEGEVEEKGAGECGMGKWMGEGMKGRERRGNKRYSVHVFR